MRTCVCVCVCAPTCVCVCVCFVRAYVYLCARVFLDLSNALLLFLIELLLESQLLLLPPYFAQNLSKIMIEIELTKIEIELTSAREPASPDSASFYASLVTSKNQKDTDKKTCRSRTHRRLISSTSSRSKRRPASVRACETVCARTGTVSVDTSIRVTRGRRSFWQRARARGGWGP